MKLKIISSNREFKDLSKSWNELLERSTKKSIFLTWEWLFSWWEIYSGRNELFIMLLYDNERLVGISPTYKRKGNIVEFRFLGDEYVDSCYLGFILDKHYKVSGTEEFLKLILEKNGAYLRYVESKNELLNINGINAAKKEFRMSSCPKIILSGDIGEYLSGLTSKTRFNIRKSEKLFQKKNIRSEIREGEDAVFYMNEVFKVNEKRWTDFGRFSKCLKSFLLNACKRLAKKKRLEIYFLILGDEIIAYNLNLIYGETISVYSAAFDISRKDIYGNSSPGLYLNYLNIKRAIEKGFKIFDMLRGENPYKMKLANSFSYNNAIMFSKKTNITFLIRMVFVSGLNKASYIIESGISEKSKNIILKIVPKSILRGIR